MTSPLHVWFLFPLMLSTLCKPEVVKERILVADDLSTDAVIVDIRSEITGKITWTYTADDYFLVKVKVVAENVNQLNATRIKFLTTNSTISVQVDESYSMNAYEPVTGTGSLHRLPVCLVWLPALMLGLGRFQTAALLLLTGAITQSSSSVFSENPTKTVQIDIIAPLHYQYKDVNLYIKDGKVEYAKHQDEITANITCRTDMYDTGCPQCCHGNGACAHGRCVCRGNYTLESNCETEDVTRSFFSHPMDPRLEAMELYNGDTITLSHLFNVLQRQQDLTNPDKFGLNYKSRDGTMSYSNILVTIHSDGFIDEIIDLNDGERFDKVKFRRFKTKKCTIRIKIKNLKLDVNICDLSEDNVQNVFQHNSSDIDTDTTVNKDLKNNHKSNERMHKYFDYFGFNNYTDIPVKMERCGYESMAKKLVFCKLSTLLHSSAVRYESNRNEYHKNKLTDNYLGKHGYMPVTMATHEKQNGVVVLRLPKSTQPLEKDDINKKCEFTSLKRLHICSFTHRQIYRTICDKLSNTKFDEHSPGVTSLNFSNICRVFLNLVSNYCDIHKRSEKSACTFKYGEIVNLFAAEYFQIRPTVLYSDDKIVTGNEHNIAIENTQQEELTIIDSRPEFKIVKISVIPSDPVPHDIYQVRMDYECATKHTVVNMTVSGSDLYSNHMTCRGITSCSCCIVHAAGAPNAVIDHVIIKVTDPSYGFDLEKETLIVF